MVVPNQMSGFVENQLAKYQLNTIKFFVWANRSWDLVIEITVCIPFKYVYIVTI